MYAPANWTRPQGDLHDKARSHSRLGVSRVRGWCRVRAERDRRPPGGTPREAIRIIFAVKQQYVVWNAPNSFGVTTRAKKRSRRKTRWPRVYVRRRRYQSPDVLQGLHEHDTRRAEASNGLRPQQRGRLA